MPVPPEPVSLPDPLVGLPLEDESSAAVVEPVVVEVVAAVVDAVVVVPSEPIAVVLSVVVAAVLWPVIAPSSPGADSSSEHDDIEQTRLKMPSCVRPKRFKIGLSRLRMGKLSSWAASCHGARAGQNHFEARVPAPRR
jgi:hypothetical protein